MTGEASTRTASDPSRSILRLTYPDGSVRVFDEDAERAIGRGDWSRAEWIDRAEAGGATADPAPGFAARFGPLKYNERGEWIETADGRVVADMMFETDLSSRENDRYGRAFVAGLDALDVLREIEWRGGIDPDGDGFPTCPACGSDSDHGHAADCRLAAALRKATGEGRS